LVLSALRLFNAWFGSLVWPGLAGLAIGGPVGLAAGTAVGGIFAYEFERKMWKRIQENCKEGEPSSTYFGVG
jgi:hypothetical protein